MQETDSNGWTTLHYSSKSSSYELVKFFANKGADIQVKTKDGENCLHIAALEGHLKFCVTFVEKYDFDISVTDNNGWTGLLCSAKNGNFALLKFFLEKGSEIYSKTNKIENILHWNTSSKIINIITLKIKEH